MTSPGPTLRPRAPFRDKAKTRVRLRLVHGRHGDLYGLTTGTGGT